MEPVWVSGWASRQEVMIRHNPSDIAMLQRKASDYVKLVLYKRFLWFQGYGPSLIPNGRLGYILGPSSLDSSVWLYRPQDWKKFFSASKNVNNPHYNGQMLWKEKWYQMFILLNPFLHLCSWPLESLLTRQPPDIFWQTFFFNFVYIFQVVSLREEVYNKLDYNFNIPKQVFFDPRALSTFHTPKILL